MTSTADLNASEPPSESEDSVPLRQLLRVVGRCCHDCSGRCLAREVVWSIALGFQDAPRCLPCLGRGLGRDPTELQAQLADYVRRRECYSVAWAEACRIDGEVPAATAGPTFSAYIVTVLRKEALQLLADGAALVQFDEPVLTEVVFTRPAGR